MTSKVKQNNEKLLRDALAQLLKRYLELANSGDAGSWNPETEEEVIKALAALEETKPKSKEK